MPINKLRDFQASKTEDRKRLFKDSYVHFAFRTFAAFTNNKYIESNKKKRFRWLWKTVFVFFFISLSNT